jgi:hypothetical protein
MNRLFEIAANTVLLIAGFVSICWLFAQCLKRSDDPAKLLFKFLVTLAVVIGEIFFVLVMAGRFGGNVGGAFLAAGSLGVFGFILSIIWTPQISRFLLSLLTIDFDGGTRPKPDYSTAIAKRKLNNPLEAAVAVRKQLDKCPNDFEGVMLLASIQAEDLKDLRSADITLNHFCEWGEAPPKEVAAALTQLADWHLKFYHDVASAKATLQRIIKKFPDTELAMAARERFGHPESAGKNGRRIQRSDWF